MFQRGHIISATSLVKNFKKVNKYILDNKPGPILITQKSGPMLVLSTAELFERLAELDLRDEGIEVPAAYLREVLADKNA